MYRPPLLAVPPNVTLPEPESSPQWYGEVWIKYPLDHVPSPAHHSSGFKARAELITIINEIATVYFTSPKPQGRQPLDCVVGFYSKLRAWFDRLPVALTPTSIALPSQLNLQYVGILKV
jgi:hypothetical protein